MKKVSSTHALRYMYKFPTLMNKTIPPVNASHTCTFAASKPAQHGALAQKGVVSTPTSSGPIALMVVHLRHPPSTRIPLTHNNPSAATVPTRAGLSASSTSSSQSQRNERRGVVEESCCPSIKWMMENRENNCS